MSLLKSLCIKRLRFIASGVDVGRKGLSVEAINAVNDFDGSYKGVMELSGKLSVIAEMSTFDDYWQEQVQRGIDKMEGRWLELTNKERK